MSSGRAEAARKIRVVVVVVLNVVDVTLVVLQHVWCGGRDAVVNAPLQDVLDDKTITATSRRDDQQIDRCFMVIIIIIVVAENGLTEAAAKQQR